MNNWTIYQIVNYLINKNQVGNAFTPEQFELILNNSSLKLFKERLGTPEEGGRGIQGYASITKILVDLADFVKKENISYTNGTGAIPSDMAYPVGMNYKKPNNTCDGGYENRNVELLDEGEYQMRIVSTLKAISFLFPVYRITTLLNIEPITIQYSDFTYLKYPNEAVFATVTNSTTGEVEYDSANSTELEWNNTAKESIIAVILSSTGLNLRSNEIIQAAEATKQRGV